MSIVAVRPGANGRLAIVPPQEIPGGAPCYDHDQRPATCMADLGHHALIKRADNSFHWRSRALITPVQQN